MKLKKPLIIALLTFASAAEAQVSYCKDIGGGKTYCTGGTIIHRNGGTTIIQNHDPSQPTAAMPQANPLLQNNALPTLNAPYSGAGTQTTLPALPPPAVQPSAPMAPVTPVMVVPTGKGRVCHQFGNTLVCN
ncbi:MAG: hypothetical protein AMXMBFR31_25670 [Candidatus Desulfobacillus denitrificans]